VRPGHGLPRWTCPGAACSDSSASFAVSSTDSGAAAGSQSRTGTTSPDPSSNATADTGTFYGHVLLE